MDGRLGVCRLVAGSRGEEEEGRRDEQRRSGIGDGVTVWWWNEWKVYKGGEGEGEWD